MKSILLLIAFIFSILIFICRPIIQDEYDSFRDYGKRIIDETKITKKTAVMFDIDNTLLHGPQPIKPMIELCNYAKSKNIKVIIITARPQMDYSQILTRKQLAKHGIMYDQLFFCPAVQKKTLKESLDVDFILSVGDAWTDVDGKNSGKIIKLKNTKSIV